MAKLISEEIPSANRLPDGTRANESGLFHGSKTLTPR